MQGLILAAGMGKRLQFLTENNPKCMVKVNGVTLIERALRQLDKLHLSRVVVVVGYRGSQLIEYIKSLKIKTPICFVDNPIYNQTNNIYSLSLAKEYLKMEDTILLESDLIFEDKILEDLLYDKRENLALVDKYERWMDGTCLKLGNNDEIEEFIPGKRFQYRDIDSYYKTVNIYKFSKKFSEMYYVPFLEAYTKALGMNQYYEEVLRVITILDNQEIKAKRLEGQVWYEVDDIQDLDIASSFFEEDEYKKLDKIQSRYGGYWRYPKLLDFCCPVNQYFPPQKLLDEITASLGTLITKYPSGIEVNSLLASKILEVKQEHVLVGNGIPELIKSLMSKINGKTGIIQTIFNEYSKRNQGEILTYIPDNNELKYSIEDIINFFESKKIENLIIANPDNSSGNYITKSNMLKLVEWAKNKNIRLIIDESFIDYSDEEDGSLIAEDYLNAYKGLCIIKSISESHGIPGIRLGTFVTADTDLLKSMKEDISIWNINSISEFYMQISEKYKKEYVNALKELRSIRNKFINDLSRIDSIEVWESQSNHIMIRLKKGFTSREIAKRLLIENNILVKDLSTKLASDKEQFIRVAISSKEKNNVLVESLSTILKD